MASGGERIATANAVQKGADTVIVTCMVDGLQVGMFNSKPKNGVVSVKIKPQGFDMTVQVNDKGKETTFRKVVKKLPGKVDVDQCKWKAEKGKVVITLVKENKDQSWEAQLSMRGLEQQSEDEDDN